ncbi:hypothetical protein J3Q64DRAFT_1845417 [Phycomyces blakesleeanus]
MRSTCSFPMTSKLPHEILSIIAKFLPPDTRSICSIVCKQWQQPFQDAIPSELSITNHNLKDICDQLDSNIYFKRHLVQHLNLYCISTRNREYLPVLQSLFPAIQSFHYVEQTNRDISIESLLDFGLWKSLTHLDIYIQQRSNFETKNVLEKLSSLPHIVHFTFMRMHPYLAPSFVTWQDIDCLHNNLPLLRVLKLGVRLFPISSDDISTIRQTVPANRMAYAKYTDSYIDSTWLFYFALKYPFLRTIDFSDYFHKREPYADYNKEREMKLLSTHPSFFLHLKNVYVYENSRNGWPMTTFYDTLSHFSAPLKHMDINIANGNDGYALTHNINTWANLFSKTMETLDITVSFARHTSMSNPITLSIYPRLTKLVISAEYKSIEIDHILDQCPGLLMLKLSKNAISLRNPSSAFQSTHGLRKLYVDISDTNIRVINYVSSRCRQLKYLTLDKIAPKDTDFDKTGYLLFDMSFSQLNELRMWDLKLEGGFKFFVIEQAETVLQYTENSPMGHSSEQSSSTQGYRSEWYHTGKDGPLGREKKIVWKLKEDDVEFVKTYYQKAKDKNSYSYKPSKPQSDYLEDLTSKASWKEDVYGGYVVFRCKHVKKYNVGL